MTKINKISPSLWFDNNAEEAMNFYISIFKNSRVIESKTYQNSGPDEKQEVFVCTFELEGQTFMGLNGGPLFKPNEAVSFSIDCKDQEEVDYFWEKLMAGGGEESQCGWLKDKYGFSWQVVPQALNEIFNRPDQAGVQRAMHAMLQMRKLIVEDLENAYNGK